MLKTTVLGDLRGPFDPERHGVDDQAAEPGVIQPGERGPELIRRGRVRACQEIEGLAWIVINPCVRSDSSTSAGMYGTIARQAGMAWEAPEVSIAALGIGRV